jgi:hypothetical protein
MSRRSSASARVLEVTQHQLRRVAGDGAHQHEHDHRDDQERQVRSAMRFRAIAGKRASPWD